MLLTAKENGGAHGIGLMSVKPIVEESAGSMDITITDGRFIVSVLMYGDRL